MKYVLHGSGEESWDVPEVFSAALDLIAKLKQERKRKTREKSEKLQRNHMSDFLYFFN